MQTALETKKVQIISSGSEYVAQTLTELPDEKTDDVLKLVAAMEEDDDVQNVYTALA
jgi:transcriptional/translational regulatory protein YebC/TACO1